MDEGALAFLGLLGDERDLVGSRAEEAIFLEGGVVVKLDVLGKEALLTDRDAPRFLDRVL